MSPDDDPTSSCIHFSNSLMVLELWFAGKKLVYNYPPTTVSIILLWALIKWRITTKIFLKGFLICALILTGEFLFVYSTLEVPPYLQLS